MENNGQICLCLETSKPKALSTLSTEQSAEQLPVILVSWIKQNSFCACTTVCCSQGEGCKTWPRNGRRVDQQMVSSSSFDLGQRQCGLFMLHKRGTLPHNVQRSACWLGRRRSPAMWKWSRRHGSAYCMLRAMGSMTHMLIRQHTYGISWPVIHDRSVCSL